MRARLLGNHYTQLPGNGVFQGSGPGCSYSRAHLEALLNAICPYGTAGSGTSTVAWPTWNGWPGGGGPACTYYMSHMFSASGSLQAICPYTGGDDDCVFPFRMPAFLESAFWGTVGALANPLVGNTMPGHAATIVSGIFNVVQDISEGRSLVGAATEAIAKGGGTTVIGMGAAAIFTGPLGITVGVLGGAFYVGILGNWLAQSTDAPDWLREASHEELDPYTGQLRGSMHTPCPYTS